MRRLLLALAGAVALLLLLLALLPWWWGLLLRVAGPRAGVTFAEYQVVGYGRWALEDVVVRQPGVTIRLERIEAAHPLRWALRPQAGSGVQGGAWEVVVTPTEEVREPEEGREPAGWQQTQRLVAQVEAALSRWLPQARLGPGVVHWPEGEVRVARAVWEDRHLTVEGVQFQDWAAEAEVMWRDDLVGPRVRARTLDDAITLEADLAVADVSGAVTWQAQRATFRALFPAHGWMPDEADVRAADWRLRGEDLRLAEYYPVVQADLRAQWRQGRGEVQLEAAGEPRDAETWPSFRVVVDAAGRFDEVTVRALQVQAPGLEAQLDRAVTFDPRGDYATPADFTVTADLAALPWVEARGQLNGLVQVRPQGTNWPQVEAEVRLADGAYAEVEGLSATARAQLEWPWLTLTETTWNDAAGTSVQARGRMQLDEPRAESLVVSGRVVSASLAPWMPDAVALGEIQIEAQASGPFDRLQHEGRIELSELVVEGVHPLRAQAGWTGEGAHVSAEATVRSPRAQAQLAVRVDPEAAEVTRLRISRGERELLATTQSAFVRWTPRWEVRGVRLQGTVGEVAAEMDDVAAGRVALQVPRLDLNWLRDWMTEPPPVRQVRDLAIRGDLVNDALHFNTEGQVELRLADEHNVVVLVRALGTNRGIQVEQLEARLGREPIVVLSGALPISLRPGQPEVVRIDENGPVALRGRVAPSPGFWKAVAQETGVRVEEPLVEVDLKGRWSAPVGTARLAAAKVEMDRQRWGETMPMISGFEAALEGDGQGLVLERLQVDVEGQRIHARGRVPLTPKQWEAAREAPLEYLRMHGEGFVELPSADLAPLARLAPAFLAPAGNVRARLEFPGAGRILGAMQLRGAVSRPLGPLGVLQDIQADIIFAGREVDVQNVQATMGGQPVRLTGKVSLPQDGGAPHAKLQLRGQNVPLVRETGVLLRADLDLGLESTNRGEGRVTGLVRLRDGLFLVDLQDVVPRGGGGASRPAARPPYFSVTAEPLNAWRLDVAVEGRQFMRLRTPVLTGMASARFQLTGTLGEPRAIGEATLDEARIRLPFATFTIEEGEVRLTQADPYQPQLSLTGTSRRMGYDLRLELTGTASEPRLQFSSSPSLPSEDILLMVMAGQAPQDEVTYTGQQRAMQIGTYLGRGLFGDLFGGDGAERLTITSGERISRQGRETYRFEYELTPRLSAVGEYDEFDSYNAGVRWRLLPRAQRSEEEDAR
jgi:translocation and assembly module TamB